MAQKETFFELKIVLPRKQALCLEVERLQILCKSGWRGILLNHGPLIALLQPHCLSCGIIDGETRSIYVDGGILQVENGRALILTPDCEDRSDSALPSV